MFVLWILFDVVWIDFSCDSVPFFVFSVPFGSTFARCCRKKKKKKVFWGHPLCLLLVLAVLLPKQNTSYSSCKKKSIDTQPLCLSWHTGMWVSPSCMLVLLRMLCSCSAAVLFSAVGTPLLYSGPSLSLCCPNITAPSPGRTRCPAQLSSHLYS